MLALRDRLTAAEKTGRRAEVNSPGRHGIDRRVCRDRAGRKRQYYETHEDAEQEACIRGLNGVHFDHPQRQQADCWKLRYRRRGDLVINEPFING